MFPLYLRVAGMLPELCGGELLSQLDIKLSELPVTYINFIWEHDGWNFLYEIPPLAPPIGTWVGRQKADGTLISLGRIQ